MKTSRLKSARSFGLLLLAIGIIVLSIAPVYAATVSNNNDSGAGSLRQAIIDANVLGGSQTISFSGTFGPDNPINLLSNLDTITFTPTFDVSGATGTVTVKGGTMNSTPVVTFDGGGTLALSTGASMTDSSTLIVGNAGTATLNITNSATVSNGYEYIGNIAGSNGTVTVDGTSSKWTINGRNYIGNSGTGKLTISNGGVVNTTDRVNIGYLANSSGEVIVDGPNSTLTSTNTATCDVGSSGTGKLTISNGGVVNSSASPMIVGNSNGSVGTLDISGANSKLTMTTSGGSIYVGRNSGSKGTMTVSDGGKFKGGSLRVGYSGIGTLTVSGGGEVDVTWGVIRLGEGSSGTGTLNVGTGGAAGIFTSVASVSSILGTGTVNFNHNETAYTFATSITGPLTVNHIGTGTTTLTGTNTYTGLTTINSGTLAIGAGATSALGTGAVTNNATLDVGTTALSGIGVYTQNTAGSKLKVTVDTISTSGKLSSNSAAVVTADGSVDVTIADNIYIPAGTTFTIIDTTGSGVSVPGTINSLTTSRIAFSGAASNGDLILTANRSSTGFSSLSSNSNASSAGTVLDNVTNPSSDMTTVLDTLEGLSNAQTASALNTMVPEVDAGVMNISTASLNNFVGASLERVQSVLTAAAGNSANTGISTGDKEKLNGIWAKGYGSYLTQGTRKGIAGYDAWNAGTAVGLDRLFSDTLTLGVSGGYAYGKVNSDANEAKTNINSAQGTIYAGYQDANIPYFIDAAGSFAWNWYKGKRDISVGTINRTAYSDYDGQQYGVYLGGGYKFNLGKNLELTPLASIQWNHLRLADYTETEAGSMNLSVDRQSYDILQSGLGARVTSQLKYKWGNFTPEVHAKWLYNFISDAMAVTSAYTGGGGSFATNGAKPAKNGVNLGGKLSFDLKNNISIIAECDTEMRDEFFGVYGAATLRYKF